jgi:diketogulonate reductase-like aldo/keto reductase
MAGRAEWAHPTMPEMIQHSIPGTGERIPVVGLGSWRTFDTNPDDARRHTLRGVLQAFAAAGRGMVDTSPMYGNAETALGELLAETRLTGQLFLATKVWARGRSEGIRQMQESLRRLRVERLDLMQVHNLADWRTHLETLRAWKAEGRVRYLGVSHYSESAYAEMMQAIETGDIDFVQVNYSIVSRAAEKHLLPFAAERGVGVIVNRPFEENALFPRVHGRPLPAWAADIDCTSWAQFFLKFVLSHPAVTCAIPATANPVHLRDNLGAAQGRLPDAAQRHRMTIHLRDL